MSEVTRFVKCVYLRLEILGHLNRDNRSKMSIHSTPSLSNFMNGFQCFQSICDPEDPKLGRQTEVSDMGTGLVPTGNSLKGR